MRIVVDTNLLVSGVISVGGLPRQLIDAVRTGAFELCTSEPLLAELFDVLSRNKIAARLAQAGLTPDDIVDELRRLAMIASTPATPPRVVPGDPDDDHVLAAAVAGAADSNVICCRYAHMPASPSSPLGTRSKDSVHVSRSDARAPTSSFPAFANARPR